jgi:CDP-glycerol glycerophosphotransferase (TagB/SpsB family)
MLIKIVKYIINLPLYHFAKLVPKKKNLWLFGSWFGDKYADNTRFFFEYVIKNKKEIRAVWLSNNHEIIRELRSKNFESYYAYSLHGYLLSLHASKSFCSVSYGDLNLFVHAQKVINMWHGSPLKKIGYDDKYIKVKENKIIMYLKKWFLPFIKSLESYDCIICSSEEERVNLASAFGKNINDVLLTGLPRNSFLSKEKNSKNSNHTFKVLYLPTHRNEGIINSVYENIVLSMGEINNFLDRNPNITLDIKMHFYHNNASLFNGAHTNFRNITEQRYDLYEVLVEYDVLITDYSSIFFDFLLCQKPIIFFPFDISCYLLEDRELYFDYNEVTPGAKCFSWKEVLENIKLLSEGEDNFKELRKNCKIRFHKFEGDEIMEQVFNQVVSR